jgi:hypothetical protein
VALPDGIRVHQPPAQRTGVGPERRQYWPTTGWRATPPAAQGMDAKILAGIDSGVADRYPQVHSLLVVRHGYLVYEWYWHGHNATTGESVFSTTKSVNSALVGIALHDGRIKTVNQTAGELLAPHLPPAMDPRMRKRDRRTVADHDRRHARRRRRQRRYDHRAGKQPRPGAVHPRPASGHRAGHHRYRM